MHLVIATRIEPPLLLARLCTQRQLVKLSADDLRFTLPETQTFIDHTLVMPLEQRDVALLQERTEGWITGVQLATLSLRGCSDIHHRLL